jgi:hypothetical protein
MKDLVDKSMGIVTHITETLARIKPTEPLRLDKREAWKKRNCSDSSGNSPTKIPISRCVCKKSSRTKVLIDTTRSVYGDRQEHNGIRSIRVYLTIIPNLYSGFLLEGTIRMRSTGGRYSVCECSVCMVSGTSISVMSHCDIHHECTRRDPIIFSDHRKGQN